MFYFNHSKNSSNDRKHIFNSISIIIFLKKTLFNQYKKLYIFLKKIFLNQYKKQICYQENKVHLQKLIKFRL